MDHHPRQQQRQIPDAWEQLRQIVLQQRPFQVPQKNKAKNINVTHFLEKSVSKKDNFIDK